MRVLLACASFPPNGKGGGPVSSELLARGLAARGHDVRVVTVADRESMESDGVLEVHTLPSLNVHWDYWKQNPTWRTALWHLLENFNPRAFLAMRREIKAFRPDMMLTISIENINVASWLAARFERVPCAHMLYSYFLRCWRGSMFKGGSNCQGACLDCRLFSVGKRMLSRCVDGVLAETDFCLRSHTESGYFPNALRHVTPGAVTLPRAGPRSRASDAPLRVGYIGLHSPSKGIETVAAAARALAEESTQFIVAGDGPPSYTEELKALFPAASTRFPGWVRPETFFPEIDVLVTPSIWSEPFGRVTVEAMSYGVPVIVARSGGLGENIVEGESGFSFLPGDSSELVRLIRLLAGDSDLLRRMSDAALARAEHFSLERIAEDLEKFLVDVMRAKGEHEMPASSALNAANGLKRSKPEMRGSN